MLDSRDPFSDFTLRPSAAIMRKQLRKIFEMRTDLKLATLVVAMAAMAPATPSFAQSAPRQATNDSGGGDDERLVCRRAVDTGSLVRGRRQCFTRAQWDRIAEAAQKRATEMQEAFRTRPAGSDE